MLDTQLGKVSNFNEVRFLTRLVHVTSGGGYWGSVGSGFLQLRYSTIVSPAFPSSEDSNLSINPRKSRL